MTELYRPTAGYLNIGQNSWMNILKMQAYVLRCVCGGAVYVCVWGRGAEGERIKFKEHFLYINELAVEH